MRCCVNCFYTVAYGGHEIDNPALFNGTVYSQKLLSLEMNHTFPFLNGLACETSASGRVHVAVVTVVIPVDAYNFYNIRRFI